MASEATHHGDTQQLREKFLKLRSQALKYGLNEKQVREALEYKPGKTPEPTNDLAKKWKQFQTYLINPAHRVQVLVVALAVVVGLTVASYELVFDYITETPCILDANYHVFEEAFRPLVDCNICKDIYSVPEERNLSPESFYEKYSFTGRPVLVKGAIVNWTAMSTFSFKYFQSVYTRTQGALDVIDEECQFFPYKTEFITLAEALNMSDDRAAFKEGEKGWYIGWSNCHPGVSKELRRHYQRPYFLPPDSETVAEDWIFMGGSGVGAAIHLDYVERPSWQAQISGTKTWILVPSPECEATCRTFNVTVHKGDIIVLDTNIWYHSTFVHPGEISITIGSEYD